MTSSDFRSFAAHRRSLRTAALTLVFAGLLQACGGGGGSETADANIPPPTVPPPSTSPPPAPVNQAPTISGAALTSVQAGQAYTFTPSATDADSNTLTFSIANKPTWASFNAATGTLSGTPTTAQIGSFANVTISVSDGTATASLSAFSISVTAAPVVTGSATVSWLPPTQRSDGTALVNLAGYNIRYGTSSGTYTETVRITTPGITTHQIDNLQAGTYYFVVTAFDSSGNESPYSSAASKTIG